MLKFTKTVPFFRQVERFNSEYKGFEFTISKGSIESPYHILLLDTSTYAYFNSYWKDITFDTFKEAEKWCIEVLSFYKDTRIKFTLKHTEVLNSFINR